MDLIFAAFGDIFTFTNILYICFGVALGIFLGAIPGIGPPVVMAAMTPLTFYMNPLAAIAFLLGMLKGGYYGGAISAILLNAPGTPDAAAACFDGYPLAKQGKGEKALKMSLYSSVIGDTFSDLVLIAVAAPIATLALKMGPPEITLIIVLAMTMMSSFLGKSFYKSIIAAGVGMFLGTVGLDPVNAESRLTMGMIELEDGIPMVSMFIGVLALSEILMQIEDRASGAQTFIKLSKSEKKQNRNLSWKEFKESFRTIIRSSVIGTVIGALPGLGATIAAFFAYGLAKRLSKKPKLFGRGSLEGIAAAEASNNATCGANLIPLFSLGIPGNASAALLIGVFMIHGINPGPLMFKENTRLIYGIFGAIMLANLFNLLIGQIGLRFFSKIISVKKEIIYPVIILFCMTGVYMYSNSLFEIGAMIVFGWLSYFMRKLDFSFITFIIGYVLGPILEYSLSQSLILYQNNLMIFIQRPISLTLLLTIFLYIGYIIYREKKSQKTLLQGQ